jgi:hypothetical protein
MDNCIRRPGTSSLLNLRATSTARHSRPYSSVIVSGRKDGHRGCAPPRGRSSTHHRGTAASDARRGRRWTAAPPLALFGGHLQFFLPPDRLCSPVVDAEALGHQQPRHPPVAIAAVLAGQRDDPVSQNRLVTMDLPRPPLRPGRCGPGLAEAGDRTQLDDDGHPLAAPPFARPRHSGMRRRGGARPDRVTARRTACPPGPRREVSVGGLWNWRR